MTTVSTVGALAKPNQTSITLVTDVADTGGAVILVVRPTSMGSSNVNRSTPLASYLQQQQHHAGESSMMSCGNQSWSSGSSINNIGVKSHTINHASILIHRFGGLHIFSNNSIMPGRAL
jgi:hypothetical protein